MKKPPEKIIKIFLWLHPTCFYFFYNIGEHAKVFSNINVKSVYQNAIKTTERKANTMYNLNAKIMNNGIKMRKFSVSAFVRLFGGIMCENSDRRVTHME